MKRTWDGQLRGRDERVQVRMINGDGWQELTVEFHTEREGWLDADSIEDRTPSQSVYDIWVAKFPGGNELLVEYWRESETLTVAYRSLSSYSWGPPATLVEMVKP